MSPERYAACPPHDEENHMFEADANNCLLNKGSKKEEKSCCKLLSYDRFLLSVILLLLALNLLSVWLWTKSTPILKPESSDYYRELSFFTVN
jgi:hypothetical protein